MTRAAVERTVEKHFPVVAGVTLKIDTCQGAIRVETSADGQIHVLIRETITAADDAEADLRLQDLDLKIEQTADSVLLLARYRRQAHWMWQSWPPVGLSYVVNVPRGCNLDLTTLEGDITIGAIEGAVRARVETGAIFTGEVTGSVDAACTRGDLSVTACSGALTLLTKAGNVLVGRAGGLTKIDGAGGTIEVQNSRGKLSVAANNADIKIGFAHPLTESADLHAAGGDIEVAFDRRSACTLSAFSSMFGRVRVRDLPLTVESGKIGSSHLIVTLNGGGPTILVDASGGNVHLVGREP